MNDGATKYGWKVQEWRANYQGEMIWSTIRHSRTQAAAEKYAASVKGPYPIRVIAEASNG